MAKVKNPLLSSDATGTLSGLTYGNSRGIRIVRIKPQRTRRLNVNLAVTRAAVGYLARVWSTLTDVQRQAWRDWARNHQLTDRLGVQFAQTGFNAFCGMNYAKVASGASVGVNTSPPVDEFLAGIRNLVLSNLVPIGGFLATWTMNIQVSQTRRIELQVTRPATSAGRMAVSNRWRPGLTFSSATASTNVTGLIVNAWYWCRVRIVRDTGERSAWVMGQVQAK